MAPVLPFLSIAGAGLSAGGSILGGFAQGNAASYQAQIAANNAKIANQNAADAAAAGHAQEEQQGMKGAAQMGAIKAELASNGVDVNTGSAKTVETSAREEEQLNTLNVANKAALQVYGYRAQQENFLAEESLYKSEAEEAPIAGLLGGAGGLLGAAKGFGGAGLFGSQTPSSSNGPGLGS